MYTDITSYKKANNTMKEVNEFLDRLPHSYTYAGTGFLRVNAGFTRRFPFSYTVPHLCQNDPCGCQHTTEAGRYAAGLGKYAVELGKNVSELGKNAAGLGKNAAEVGKSVVELGKYVSELGKNAVELGKNAAFLPNDAAKKRLCGAFSYPPKLVLKEANYV
jgi:hypothetical protein